MTNDQLSQLAKLVRWEVLEMTTQAGSGHPTSCLSATDLMAVLFWGGFLKQDLKNFERPENDRLIFSKGHAAPLFYTLYAVSGAFDRDQLKTLRKLNSPLEGHPTLEFPYTEVPTGSLGQGLSVGVGMALEAQNLSQTGAHVFVLLGDSELSEGSNWEAMQVAAFYGLKNLVAIVDVNRLGQRGPTMVGTDVHTYARRAKAFGWQTMIIDGHNLDEIKRAYQWATSNDQTDDQPKMILAKTIKGKGVDFLEDAEGWHGKALNQEELERAVAQLGEVDLALTGEVAQPETQVEVVSAISEVENEEGDNSQDQLKFELGGVMATRKAYGQALAALGAKYQNVLALDAEVSNSTYAALFKEKFPNRFWEMFIAEQNMVGVAMGLAARGYVPFVSTFAAFLTRAFDQLRMAGQAELNVKVVGSHAGVSIGEDGSSQMGLEDLAMMRSIWGSTVFYPADAVATAKLTELMIHTPGVCYLRTTRAETPVIYGAEAEFKVGGSQTLKSSDHDQVTLVGAGITLHQILAAAATLEQKNIHCRVIDLYSLKPVDKQTLLTALKATQALITVEDHYLEGGLYSAVCEAVADQSTTSIYPLAVTKKPHSGQPAELLAMEKIDAAAIVELVTSIVS